MWIYIPLPTYFLKEHCSFDAILNILFFHPVRISRKATHSLSKPSLICTAFMKFSWCSLNERTFFSQYKEFYIT